MPSALPTLAAVCGLPVDYRRRDLSPYRLVEESGYRAQRASITHADICSHLRTHPELIDDWWMYSENKRTSSGWYFDAPSRRIGYHSRGIFEREQTFEDAAEACATFIQHELDSIINHPA